MPLATISFFFLRKRQLAATWRNFLLISLALCSCCNLSRIVLLANKPDVYWICGRVWIVHGFNELKTLSQCICYAASSFQNQWHYMNSMCVLAILLGLRWWFVHSHVTKWFLDQWRQMSITENVCKIWVISTKCMIINRCMIDLMYISHIILGKKRTKRCPILMSIWQQNSAAIYVVNFVM